MNLMNGYWMTENRQGDIWTNIPAGGKTGIMLNNDNQSIKSAARYLLKCFRSKYYPTTSKEARLNQFITMMNQISGISSTGEKIEPISVEDRNLLEDTMNKIIDFFKEFEFQPNFRFINTLSFAVLDNASNAKVYVANYFKLIDSPYSNAVIDKMNSSEFTLILQNLKIRKPSKVINQRFEIFYGSQGTGKTTKAIELAEGNCMVCHSAMLPSDLMEDFTFEEGKAAFKPSALQTAMVEGKKIVLDEINLLPFESLRFLQSILDGKAQFEYKGKTIKIADGFKIYGTMNLSVNGVVYALPAPLVDRACNLKEFELTGSQLLEAIL